jgi:hypothetical protein
MLLLKGLLFELTLELAPHGGKNLMLTHDSNWFHPPHQVRYGTGDKPINNVSFPSFIRPFFFSLIDNI